MSDRSAEARPDLRRYPRRPDLVSFAVVVAHLGFVYAPVFLAACSSFGPHLALLWLWFGVTNNALLNLMHEAAHFSVFERRSANDRLGHGVLAPLFLADFDGYRARHWDHHRLLGTERDPKYTYLEDIRGGRLASLSLRTLFLVEAVRKFAHQLSGRGRTTRKPEAARAPLGWVLRGAVVQCVFVCALFAASLASRAEGALDAAAHAAVAYLAVYHYGMASLTVFTATLRGIAEHQIGPGAPAVEGRAALRNFRDNPLSRLLLGAYGFSEHATHHLFPAIPSYRLPRATDDLIEAGRADMVRGPGYVPTLVSLVRGGPGATSEALLPPA